MSMPMPDYGLSFNDSSSVSQLETETAESIAQRFLKDQISDPNYTHQLSAAQLWAVRKDGTFYLISAHPDVYELLSQGTEYNLSSYIGVLIHTTGWAAPLNEDGDVDTAPSKHELRRRIALASCVTNTSAGSALSFADEKEIVLDPGTATGSLAEALVKFWEFNTIPF